MRVYLRFARTTLKIFVAILAVTGFMLVASPAYAEAPSGDISPAPSTSICDSSLEGVGNSSVCQGANQGTDATKNPVIGPNSILGKIIQMVVFLVGGVSVIMVVVGGFRYVLSGGDSNGTKAAKDTILYALIGLVIALFAQGLVSFVLTRSFF